MIIAIEGPDRAGKTTLFHNLRKYEGINAFYVPNVPTTLALLAGIECAERKCVAILEGMYDERALYVFDRCPIVSNLAYAFKYKRETEDKLRLAANWKGEIRVVYLTALAEDLKARRADDIDGDVEASMKAYDETMRYFTHQRLYTGGQDPRTISKLVAEKIRSWWREKTRARG